MTEELTTGESAQATAATEARKAVVSSPEPDIPAAVDAAGVLSADGVNAAEKSVSPDGLSLAGESVETSAPGAPTIAEAGKVEPEGSVVTAESEEAPPSGPGQNIVADAELTPEGLLIETESVETAPSKAPTIAEAGETPAPEDAQTESIGAASPETATNPETGDAIPEPSGPVAEAVVTGAPLTADELAIKAPHVETDRSRLKAVIEAVIYITDEPLSTQQIAGALAVPIEEIKTILDELTSDYAKPDRGLSIREVAGGFKLATKPEHHEEIRSFVKNLKPPLKLSLAALETLAVIAYKQPITAPEIMEIRGVQGAGVLKTLLDRKLIATAGRKNVIGKPILYKTTKEFLVQFGLKDLAELPTLKEFEELGRLALSDADADPGGQPPISEPEGNPASEPPAKDPSPTEPPQQEPPSEPPAVEEPPATPDEPTQHG